MGDGRFVCVVSPTFRNRRCGSGAVTMAAGVSYGVLFWRCSASNGGGLVPSCKLQTFHNMVLAAGKTGPTGFDCVCFFLAPFESQHRIATPTPKTVPYVTHASWHAAP